MLSLINSIPNLISRVNGHQSQFSMTQNNNQQQIEKVLVIGCGYVGKAVAIYWHQQGYFVTRITTRKEKVSEIRKITSKTIVMTVS